MKKLLPLIVACIASFTISAQTTIVLQPHFAQGTENQLTTVDNSSSLCIGNPFEHFADTNQHVVKEFDAVAWTNSGCPDFFRHVIRFDALSDTTLIPRNATIHSARLILSGIPSSPDGNYGNSYYSGTSYPNTNPTWLYEFADTFNSHTLTWNNQPAVKHVDSISIPSSYSRWNQIDTIDVTSMVADMVANVNTGFLFRLQTESYYRERMYAACHYSDSTLHPKLIVSFSGLGVKALTSASVSVFPNPAHDNIIIRTPGTATNGSVELIDESGRAVADKQLSGNTTELEIHKLPAAVYTLKIVVDGQVLYKQVVKQ